MKTVYAVMWSEVRPREFIDNGLSKVYDNIEKAKRGMIQGAFSDLLSYYEGEDEEETPFDYLKGVEGGYSTQEIKKILEDVEDASVYDSRIEFDMGAEYARWVQEVEIE